jgi:azurin
MDDFLKERGPPCGRGRDTMLRMLRLGGGLLLAARVASADPCKILIETNDMMKFNTHEMSVPATCSEVEVTLKHTGKLPAKAMGHDWVLTKDSDMSAVINAGLTAGAGHGYLPENDKRIIAATKIVGGGESTTVKFSTSELGRGTHYAFFCTSPGHASTMRGKFLFGEP